MNACMAQVLGAARVAETQRTYFSFNFTLITS